MFQWLRIRIRHFNKLNTDQDPDPGFWWPKLEKNLQLKKNLIFLSQNCNFLIHSRLPQRKSKLQENTSTLKREHPAIQTTKSKLFSLFVVILPSWIRIQIPNPDPLTWLNPDPFRIGSETLLCCHPGNSFNPKTGRASVCYTEKRKTRREDRGTATIADGMGAGW